MRMIAIISSSSVKKVALVFVPSVILAQRNALQIATLAWKESIRSFLVHTNKWYFVSKIRPQNFVRLRFGRYFIYGIAKCIITIILFLITTDPARLRPRDGFIMRRTCF